MSRCMNHLNAAQRFVLCDGGTEPAFSGAYYAHIAQGMYHCAGCHHVLFSSEAKYDSGSGWPSFFAVLMRAISLHVDDSHGMLRTEVRCANCGGHLGHVFDDGPEGKPRYCINSLALQFVPVQQE